MYVDFGVNLLRLSLEPCCLCCHHIGGLQHALLEADVGATQVFFCVLHVLTSESQSAVSLFYLELALAYLQLNLLAYLVALQLNDA